VSVTEVFEPVFVEFIPVELEESKLYISMKYSTTAHLCASGCGEKVVLPLHPAQWRLSYDGRTISITPSVGNWGIACQSHYWIRSNRVEWAPKWDSWRIDAGRTRDAKELETFFEQSKDAPARPTGLRHRVKRLLGR